MVAKGARKAEPDQKAAFQKTLQTLAKIHKDAVAARLDSVEELVVSLLTDGGVPAEQAAGVIQSVRKNYVDWNEARVARTAELARLLDPAENADDLARRLRELLGRVFDRTGAMKLSHLREMKAGEARRALMEIEPVGRAVADRILMREAPQTTVSLPPEAVKLAKRWTLLGRNDTRAQLQKLVNDLLTAEERSLFIDLLLVHAAQGCGKGKCPLCKA